MIARVRRFASPEEMRRELTAFGLDAPASMAGREFLYLEGGEGDVRDAVSASSRYGLAASASLSGRRPRAVVHGDPGRVRDMGAAWPEVDSALRGFHGSPSGFEYLRKRGFKSPKRAQVMGILNVTPDSFSDGGEHLDPEEAAAYGIRMISDGADIIDVGGESTRPGSTGTDAATEEGRAVPVIERLAAQGRPVSVDTRKAAVAQAAADAGAAMINDVSFLADPDMPEAVMASRAMYVLTHALSGPEDMQKLVTKSTYEDVVGDVLWELSVKAARLEEEGLERGRIVIDPGIGFGKLPAHNVEILRRCRELRSLGLPVLIGASRKGFIGQLAGGEPKDRLGGSLAAAAGAAMGGADVVRVHDVRETASMLRVLDALR